MAFRRSSLARRRRYSRCSRVEVLLRSGSSCFCRSSSRGAGVGAGRGFVCLAFGGSFLSGGFPGFLPRLLCPGGRFSTRVARFRQRDGELERAALSSAYCTCGRGLLVDYPHIPEANGLIPAFAGVCWLTGAAPVTILGSSPPCGVCAAQRVHGRPNIGSSPPQRGLRLPATVGVDATRFIPAPAGVCCMGKVPHLHVAGRSPRRRGLLLAPDSL